MKKEKEQLQNNITSRLRLELRSKAPQASRISTTLSGHERAPFISTFKHINFVPCYRPNPGFIIHAPENLLIKKLSQSETNVNKD